MLSNTVSVILWKSSYMTFSKSFDFFSTLASFYAKEGGATEKMKAMSKHFAEEETQGGKKCMLHFINNQEMQIKTTTTMSAVVFASPSRV